MARTAEDLVRTEVHYCVSSLVSMIAKGYGNIVHNAINGDARELAELADQAFDLMVSIDDWEEAARQEGWNGRTVDGTYWNIHDNETIDDCETWQDLCEELNIEPYQREVFEHWIVSDWLADKLAEKGEKVDKDFAGLTVWARTTTGQGIASDGVIEQIAEDLNNG